MSKMVQVEGALEAFADPGFQLLLVEAQKTAASTERPADYDLLSELLIHRFQKGENRISRAGISLAVEIVDKVSDEALLGLTVAHAVTSFTPISGNISEGLGVLNNLFGKMFYGELPRGPAWVDHLDVLNAVRLNQFGGFRKIEEYYPGKLSGYIDVGIEKNSENHNKAIELLNGHGLSTQILVEHALNSDFIRLAIPNRESINRLSCSHFNHSNHSIYNLYSSDDSKKKINLSSFMNEWDKMPNLKILREWWDNISRGFFITSVGSVLAHSNAQRCDRNLPPLD